MCYLYIIAASQPSRHKIKNVKKTQKRVSHVVQVCSKHAYIYTHTHTQPSFKVQVIRV